MNINQMTIIGHITKDPVHKNYAEGKNLTTFTIATNRKVKNKKGKEAEFHNIVTFGRLAEICKDYLKKGRLVYIQGRLRTSSWEDENKQKRYKTDVIAREMLILDKNSALVSAGVNFDDDATEAVVGVSQVTAS